jgi:membrane peptidoglycan carboxypeptidase
MAESIDMAALHPAVPVRRRLRALEQMRDQGLISQAEYEALRDEVLDEI